MRKLSKVPLLGLTFLAVASQAHADVTFHGYGQIIAGTVFSNNRSFPPLSQSTGYHADPTFTPNSNFGLQASAPLSGSISATAQILAKGDNDFQPEFQWAYLKYQLNDTFAVKAGRLQTPFYQYSDYQSVGEAYPWVILPESVYFSQVTHYDGLSLSAEKSVGDWYFLMQAIYGSVDASVSIVAPNGTGAVVGQTLHDHNLTGLTLDSSYNDWLSLRTAVFVEDITLTGDGSKDNPVTQIEDFVNYLNSQQGMSDAAKALATSNDPSLYYIFSAQITRNNWMLVTEYQGLQNIAGSSGITPNLTSEYVSFGYHFGKLLPLITFGHRNGWIRADKIKDSIPAANAATLDPIIGGIASQPGIRAKDYFYEFGLRYDLTATVALKLDYTFYQSHYKTSDYPELGGLALLGAPTAINPQDTHRLLAAVTFSF